MSWKLTKKLTACPDPSAGSLSNPTANLSTSTPSLITSTPGPLGILTVTLHEAVGLYSADQYRELFDGHEQNLGLPNCPSYHRRFHFPYALLDYNKSQVAVASILGSTGSPQWRIDSGAACKIDVSQVADLTICLYLKDPKAFKGSQDVSLGVAKLAPFDGATVSGPQWLQVQGGAGKIRISLQYTQVENEIFEIDGSEIGRLSNSGDVLQVRKKDTQR